MNKASELCEAIRNVQKLAGEIFSGNPHVEATQYHQKAIVSDIRNLEQIPGEMEISVREYDKVGFPWKASKVYEGVTFCCLLKQEQYEALKAS